MCWCVLQCQLTSWHGAALTMDRKHVHRMLMQLLKSRRYSLGSSAKLTTEAAGHST